MSLLLVLILIICLSPALIAETPLATFRGVVIDAQTEQTIPGAHVILLGSNPLRGEATDTEGRFAFYDLQAGRVDIQVSSMGYNPVEIRNLLLVSGKETVLYIRLDEQVMRISGVEVRPEVRKDRPMNEMAMVSARSFTIEDTERYAGSLGDPSRMAANFAGVSSAADQRNDIIIRGNSPLGLLWRIDGVEVPNPNHFGSMGSTGGPVGMLNNNLLSNSDFYTGAFPAEFGNALAGAFDIRLRYGNTDRREHMGQIGFNGFELGTEGPFNNKSRASYLLNIRYSTLEVLKQLGMSFGTGEAIPQYKDLAFKLNFPLQSGRVSIFGVGGSSYIEMLDSKGDSASFGFSGTDLRFLARMGVMGISHLHYFSPETRITNTISASGLKNVSRIIDLSIDPEIESIIEDDHDLKYTFSSQLFHKYDSRNFFRMGLIADLHHIQYQGKQYQEDQGRYYQYMDGKGYLGVGRVYGEWQHRFSDQFQLTSGLHASWLMLNNSFALEPRMGLRYTFLPGQTISLGAGLHSQSQLKAVYFMQEMSDTIAIGYRKSNENLDLSRSFHLVSGYDRLMGNNHRIRLEAYLQELYNIPVTPDVPSFSMLNTGGDFVFWAFHDMLNQGRGRNYGLELTIEKFLSQGFYYLVTASVFDSKSTGYNNIWLNTAFNNNYIINILGGYEWSLGKRSLLQVDFKTVYAGGKRYLPIDAQASIIENGVVYDWDQAYAQRFPDYFRLNLRISFRINGRSLNQQWALDLQNLTNHQNVFTQNWNRSTQSVSTSYQMGFMPMITYKVFF